MKTYTIRYGGHSGLQKLDFAQGIKLASSHTGREGVSLGEAQSHTKPFSNQVWAFVATQYSAQPVIHAQTREVFETELSVHNEGRRMAVALIRPEKARNPQPCTSVLVKVEVGRHDYVGIESAGAYKGNPQLLLSGTIQRVGAVPVVHDTLWILPVGSAIVIKFLNYTLDQGTVIDVTETGPQVYSYADFQAKLQ